MNKYKLTQGLLALTLLAVPMISCTDSVMDDINVDKNHAQDVQAKFIVTDLITSTAFSTVGGDFSTYASVYIEQEAGIHNQLFNAETRNGEPSSTNTYNNVWSSTYTNLKNAKTVIAKCSGEGEEAGNQITLGIGQFFAAYNLAVLTDLFGDVPWTEACDMNISMQPKIDSQESIYSDIFKLIDDAISNFDGTDAMGAVGTNDLAYGGDGGKWKKAAYALKARLTMHILNRASDKTASLNTVLDCISKSFESSSEELKFNFYDGVTNINPLFGFCFTRDALAASQSIVEKFVERNDPRGTRAFMDPDWVQREDPSEVNAAPNGKPEQLQFTYDTSIFYGSSLAPTMMLSYHELLFLKAEALCRLNKKDEAEPILKEAIQVAFNNMNRSIQATINCPDLLNYGGATAKADLTEEVAAEYFDKNVKPLFEANPLKETMIQKYLAFFGASGEAVEAYNDYRRLKAAGEDFITLKNKGKFPLRFIYGSGDATANNNIKEAVGDGQYVYSEPVWWAGGSR